MAKAKSWLRIPQELTEEDQDVGDLITAARSELEHEYNLCIMPQAVELLINRFPREDFIRFPRWPVQEVTYIHYFDTAGVQREMTVNDPTQTFSVLTRLNRKPAEIKLPFAHFWPTTILQTADSVRIGLNCGYLSGLSPEELPLPGALLSALKRLIEHGYRNRGVVTLGSLMKSEDLRFGVDRLMVNVGLSF